MGHPPIVLLAKSALNQRASPAKSAACLAPRIRRGFGHDPGNVPEFGASFLRGFFHFYFIVFLFFLGGEGFTGRRAIWVCLFLEDPPQKNRGKTNH